MNISMGKTFVGYGVGNGVSLIDFDVAFGGLEIPTGLDILWLSFAEKKFYHFKQSFSKKIQEKTLKLFQRGSMMTMGVIIVLRLPYCLEAEYGCLLQGSILIR